MLLTSSLGGGQGWSGGTTCASGLTCVFQNPYYSQCLRVSKSSTTTTSKPSTTTPVTTIKPTTSTTTRVASSTTITSSTKSLTSSAPANGPTYKASITHYGAGDTFGSPNCNTNTAACFFYTYPGYSAAVSQNLYVPSLHLVLSLLTYCHSYGVGPGAGQGPACGTCWKLVGQTDSSGNKLSNAGTSIVVMVNNLCPAQGNPLCAQQGLSGTNQYGANVNFDLCSDSGAQAAFFGNSGVGLAIGTAQQVDCSQWTGTIKH